MKRVHTLKHGKFTDSSGREVVIDARVIADLAESYDPARHRAPLVVGHPKTNAPAYGWVAKLVQRGNDLFAEPEQVNPDFSEAARTGSYPMRSASLWPPEHKGNPTPGKWSLRHIGFLGAQPPAIKGLEAIEFAEDAACVTVDFAGPFADQTLAGLLRRLREFVLVKFGAEDADRALPAYELEHLEIAAREGLRKELEPDGASPLALAEPATTEKPDETDMTVTAQQIAADRAKLDADIADFNAAKKADADARRATEVASFADGLKASGKLRAVDAPVLVELLSNLDAETEIEFSDGSDKIKQAPRAAMQKFLDRYLPVVVDLNERAASEDDPALIEFNAPSGAPVDPGLLRVHAAAVQYQAAHPGTSYFAAVTAVSS